MEFEKSDGFVYKKGMGSRRKRRRGSDLFCIFSLEILSLQTEFVDSP